MRTVIQKLIKDELDKENIYCRIATVVSVDNTERTCDVTILGETVETTGVKLQANIEGAEGIYIKPTVGSFVRVGFENKEAAFVVSYTEIDEIIINGGKNKGLVKVSELVTKLNNVEKDLNNLRNAINSWIPVPQDGGASLKSVGLVTWLPQTLIETKISDLENDKIKH